MELAGLKYQAYRSMASQGREEVLAIPPCAGTSMAACGHVLPKIIVDEESGWGSKLSLPFLFDEGLPFY